MMNPCASCTSPSFQKWISVCPSGWKSCWKFVRSWSNDGNGAFPKKRGPERRISFGHSIVCVWRVRAKVKPKELKVSPAFLSKVLIEHKDLYSKSTFAIAAKLGYNRQETSQFWQIVPLSKTSDPKVKSALSLGLNRSDLDVHYSVFRPWSLSGHFWLVLLWHLRTIALPPKTSSTLWCSMHSQTIRYFSCGCDAGFKSIGKTRFAKNRKGQVDQDLILLSDSVRRPKSRVEKLSHSDDWKSKGFNRSPSGPSARYFGHHFAH